jgi:glycosyltransferase involved in cell wall biosynthesis
MRPATFSILTPSLNQASYVDETLRSVLAQAVDVDIEYIVIDGGSTDGTVDILERYRDQLAHLIVQPDQGQADALNHGLKLASGEFVAFLNSDDLYLPGALSAAVTAFAESGADWICGDTILFGAGHPTELVSANVPRSLRQVLTWKYRAPQPGMFWRRDVVDHFDARFRYAFDHDLYVRLLRTGTRCHHLAVPVAAYRLHDASKTVAEAPSMDAEFDAISRLHEPHLAPALARRAAGFRRIRAVAHRDSGRAGDVVELARVALGDPLIIRHRAYWGTAKTVARRLL